MGVGARSNGPSLSGISADFTTSGPGPQPGPEPLPVRVSATPNLAIPDNKPAGVTSQVAVAEAGNIDQVEVTVDIQHTYVGDLRVSVAAPWGATAVLHDRTGAGTDDLIRTYTSQNTPALAAWAGQPSTGNWTLQVADIAPRDVGMLRRWELALGFGAVAQVVQQEATPALLIPDNNPGGVSSGIAIGQAGKARSLRVGVDITHTFIGDLRVTLTAPSGKQAILHNRSGSGLDNLVTTYASLTVSTLAMLVDEPIQGSWVLQVSDLAGQDVGKLNRWSLELTV
jgi:subtilisin-like proprotein convertase family protein